MRETRRVLVVDDEPSARRTLKAMLTPEGYELAFAESGQEALARLDELAPDIILLDVMMPGMDGFEACQLLKTDAQWQHVPIILVTALDSKQDLARGLDAGADDFVGKPVSSLELRARVHSMLRIKSQYDQLEKQQQELVASLHLREKLTRIVAQRLEMLSSLHEMGLRLMISSDADHITAQVAETALKAIPQATHCVMHFLSADKEHLVPVVFSAQDGAKSTPPAVGTEEIIRQAIEGREAVGIPDVLLDSRYAGPSLHEIRALLVTPLIADDNPIGAISVDSLEEDAFDIEHRRVLSILASQAAVAIMKTRLFEELERIKDQEKNAIRDLFQRYVSPIVVERLVEGPEQLALGGTRQEVSILFADIRGFTSFSETLDPERLIEVLNQYFSLAVNAILAQEGTLDKYMGDAVMALFNAPLAQADHTLRAVRAAAAMQQAIADHNTTKTDLSALNFGIGVHVGQAVVGNVGTAQHMNYTAIGDTVNLAKRLQENAIGGQIVLSQAAYRAVQDAVDVQDLGPMQVKGRTAVEHVYSLLGLV